MAKLVAATYGDALFELALQDSKVDSLYEETKVSIEAFNTNEDLGRLLKSPKIDKEEKIKVVENIFSKFASKELTGLLVMMVSKDRQADILETLKYFEGKVLEYKKIGIAHVMTAKPLTEAQKKAVTEKLLATTEYKDFRIDYEIDESLIGGISIRIGDRVVDSTIKHKLDNIQKNLRKVQL